MTETTKLIPPLNVQLEALDKALEKLEEVAEEAESVSPFHAMGVAIRYLKANAEAHRLLLGILRTELGR